MAHEQHVRHDEAVIAELAQTYGRSVEEVSALWQSTMQELKRNSTTWDYVGIFAMRRVREILGTPAE